MLISLLWWTKNKVVPQQPPINIEITGSSNYGELTQRAESLQQFLIKKNIEVFKN